jgi:hypothetical protein
MEILPVGLPRSVDRGVLPFDNPQEFHTWTHLYVSHRLPSRTFVAERSFNQTFSHLATLVYVFLVSSTQ